MFRLLYVAPLIVAVVNLCGYVQIRISSTGILIVVLGGLFFVDLSIKAGRAQTALRIRSFPVGVSVAILLISFACSTATLGDYVDYDGTGEIYKIITPSLMFFPGLWIVMTEKITQKQLVNLLRIFVCYGLVLDLCISALQLAYLYFVDPSGAIFLRNDRLNSVVQFDNIRVVGIFASGLDHGFYLTMSAGLAWVLAAANRIKAKALFFVLSVTTVLVYLTYTRTAYIAHGLLLISIVGAFARRKLGIVQSLVVGALLVISILWCVEIFNVNSVVSDLINSRSLLNLQTMESRYGSWGHYQGLLDDAPIILLTGAGLLQSAFPFIKAPPPLIDNLYLSLLLYGGIFFALSYIAYLMYYLYFFIKVTKLRNLDQFEARLLLVLCISIAIIIVVGFSATVWDLLSIGLPVSVLWALGWSYFRYSWTPKNLQSGNCSHIAI